MKSQIISFLSLTACVAALTVSGCAKEDQPAATDSNASDSDNTDGQEENEDTETSAGTDTDKPPTTDGTDSDGETGNIFVPETDIAGASSCDPWAQDCPEGEKCVAYNSAGDTWDANKCVPLEGMGQTGDECTYGGSVAGTDDCDVGFMCYYTNEEAVGICVPLCTGTPDDPLCPDGFNCSISNEGSLLLCLYSCDPLLQDCEQEGSGCFWDGSLFNCDPAGDIPTNEPCGYINDCLPGHVCSGAESLPGCNGSACCAAFCELDNPQCAIADTECISFFDEGSAPPDLVNVGVCVLPGA